MLSPEYLANCTDILLGLYDELDRAIVADIARRIVKTGGVSETARIQAERVRQSGALLENVTRMVAEISGFTDEEITRMFEEAGIQGMENDARPLILNGQSVSLKLSPAMRQTLDAAIAKTKGDMRNLTLTTGVTAMEKYREAVNAAYMMVQSGAFSYQTAIREAVKRAAVDGNWVSFASGHRDRLDVAVRRSVLTGLNQTAGKLTELYSADMGAEYYEVSAHAGARPSHVKWQGKVYKISGSAPGYPNFADSTGYGTGAGLCGWNCRHSFYPFWPGISVRAYTPELLQRYDAPKYEYGGQKLTEYEVSQMMRKNERDIRAIKRELAGYRAALEAAQDPVLQGNLQEAFDETSVGLKATEARYKDLCQKTRHEPDSARTAVVAILDKDGHIIAYDRSLAQKVRHRAEQTYQKEIAGTGADIGGPKTLAKRNELRYNNKQESELFDLYLAQVKRGTVSPMCTFENYKSQHALVEEKIVGITTSNGILITSQSKHFIERVIGTMDDPKNHLPRSGVSVDAILDALKNPLEVRQATTDSHSRLSQKFIGRYSTITVNPQTGVLVQCNPTDHEVVERLERKLRKNDP